MAGASKKKITVRNIKILKDLKLQYAIALSLALLIRLLIQPKTFHTVAGLLVSNIIHLVLHYQLYTFSSGNDLAQKGLIGYYFDVIYIGLFVMVMSGISSVWYYTYALIPMYALYKAGVLIKSLYGMRQGQNMQANKDIN